MPPARMWWRTSSTRLRFRWDHGGVGTDGSFTTVDDLETYKAALAKKNAERGAAGISAPGEGPDIHPFVTDLRAPNQYRELAAQLSACGHSDGRIEKSLGRNSCATRARSGGRRLIGNCLRASTHRSRGTSKTLRESGFAPRSIVTAHHGFDHAVRFNRGHDWTAKSEAVLRTLGAQTCQPTRSGVCGPPCQQLIRGRAHHLDPRCPPYCGAANGESAQSGSSRPLGISSGQWLRSQCSSIILPIAGGRP